MPSRAPRLLPGAIKSPWQRLDHEFPLLDRMTLLPRYGLTPLIVACALFMENLDGTVVSTSLPAIAADLHQDPIALKLAMTSYLLAQAVFIPACGWAADRFGARTVFRAAIVVFTLGSILCGLSSTLQQFVGARIIQGFGGAMMAPVGRLVLLRTVERRTRPRPGLSDHSRAARPDARPARRRLHHHLFPLALDFLDQCPDRRARHDSCQPLHPEFARRRAWPLDVRGFLLSGVGLSACHLRHDGRRARYSSAAGSWLSSLSPARSFSAFIFSTRAKRNSRSSI